MKGICLPVSQINAILKKQKTLLVSTENIKGFDNQEVLLLSKNANQNKINGIAEIKKAIKINKTELIKKEEEHLMSEYQINKLWQDKDEFYVFPIIVKRSFTSTLLWDSEEKDKTFINKVDVNATVNISIPIEKVGPEHFNYLGEQQKDGLRQRMKILNELNLVSKENLSKIENIIDQKIPTPDQDQTVLKTAFVPKFIFQAQFDYLEPEHKDTNFYDLLVVKGKPDYFLRIQENENTVNLWKLDIEDISRFEAVKAEYKGNQSVTFMKTGTKKVFTVSLGESITKFFTLDSGDILVNKLSDKAIELKFSGNFIKGHYVISRRVDTQPFIFEKIV